MKAVTIKELGEIITGHTPPTTHREYYGDYFPFVKPTDMRIGSKYTYSTEEGFSELAYNKYRSSLIPKGSTCVVCIGTLGEKMTMAHRDFFTNQSVNSIVPNENFDPDYVFYLIKYNLQKVKALNKGTASGREFVSKTTFQDLELRVFESRRAQEKIGKILSTYDALIENNNIQIKLLEETIQRIYSEWFKKYRFPGYKNKAVCNGLPSGWKEGIISDVAGVNCSSLPKSYPHDYLDYVDLGSVERGHINTETRYPIGDAPGRAKRIAKDGDIVWGVVRPNLRSFALVQNPKETNVFSTGFAVLSPTLVPFSYLYCVVSQDEFVGYLVNATNGAAYPAVRPSHFENARIVIPDKAVLDEFNKRAEPILRKIGLLDRAKKELIEARDRLLPKLMSGEIEV